MPIKKKRTTEEYICIICKKSYESEYNVLLNKLCKNCDEKNMRISDHLSIDKENRVFIFMGEKYPMTRHNFAFVKRYIKKKKPEVLEGLSKIILDI